MSDATKQTTVYVGNLAPSANEDLIRALFSPIGEVKSCSVKRKNFADPFCFVEFADPQSAETAIAAMNGRRMLERKLKVRWAYPGKSQHSKQLTVFVGGLDESVDTGTLRKAFIPFGEISKCHVVFDPATQKSSGYGFVTFLKRMEAENAILSMNGELICGRPIRTKLVKTRKIALGVEELSYEQVLNQSSPKNCSVYCVGMNMELTEEFIMMAFSPYGAIQYTRVFTDKGYAFVNFSSKESAADAIFALQHTEVNGLRLKCSWSKELCDPKQPMTADGPDSSVPNFGQLSYEEVFNQGSPNNCTVHCSGMKMELTHELVLRIFSPYGITRYIRVFKDKGFAFISYCDKRSATNAIVSVHNSEVNGHTLKCQWAKESCDPLGVKTQMAGGSSGFSTYNEVFNQSSPTNSTVYCVAMNMQLTEDLIMKTFSPYGAIRAIRVFTDDGYAFVNFLSKESATNAIVSVNNTEVNSQVCTCFWGKESSEQHQPMAAGDQADSMPNAGRLSYEHVFKQSSPTNCNVYLGGVMKGLTQQLVMETFRPYGLICKTRIFQEKGYAFVTFGNKESATNAIVSVNNTKVNGHLVKCSWGRDSGGLNQTPAPSGPAGSVSLQAAGAYCSSGQMGQWHPEPQGYPAAAQTQGFPGASQTQGYPGAAQTQGYPAAGQTQGYPGAAQTQCYQAAGQTQGYPGASQTQGFPGAAQT